MATCGTVCLAQYHPELTMLVLTITLRISQKNTILALLSLSAASVQLYSSVLDALSTNTEADCFGLRS